MEKRFQECNKIEKIWRYRWYLLIPFLWSYYQIKGGIPVSEYETGEVDYIKGKNSWKLLIGQMQTKMNWYYTWEEVMDSINEKRTSK